MHMRDKQNTSHRLSSSFFTVSASCFRTFAAISAQSLVFKLYTATLSNMGRSKIKAQKPPKADIAVFSGNKKTFDEDSDNEERDLEAILEEEEARTKKSNGGDRNSPDSEEDVDDDAPEEERMDGAEMQRLREMFEKHAPKEGTKGKKKKRKPRPTAELIDPNDMLDASILEGIDTEQVDAHKRITETDLDSEDDESKGTKNEKGGFKIDKNKRGSKIIGDLHVKVLGKEDPIKMMIKSSSGRGSKKMTDLLDESVRESYSVFASQKKRRRAGKFVQ